MAKKHPAKTPSEPKIAVIDLETDPFAPDRGAEDINAFAAGFFDGERTEIYWGDDAAEKLCKRLRKYEGLVFAHNGGNFDVHFLLEHMSAPRCEFLTMGKRIVSMKTPWGLDIRDSFAIIPKALAAYNKTPIDYEKFERPVREKHKAEIIAYLKDDLKFNRDMIVAFAKRFPLEKTLASSVFKLMKSEFGYDPKRSDARFDGQFRKFFFGGRVQYWRLGYVPGNWSVVDINSAYPWAMTEDHWFMHDYAIASKIPDHHAEQSFYVVECYSEGVLPERQKNGGIEFPHKRGRFFCTGWELLAGIELGLIRDLRIVVAYVPEEIKSMRNFAETLYGRKHAAKVAGDKEEEFFAKIAVNSGYGKLALNPENFSEMCCTDLWKKPKRWESAAEKKRNPEKEEWKECWSDPDRGLTFWKRSSYRLGIDKFINVATAASITGCVRAFLLRSIHACGGFSKVAYCDTDSLIAENVDNLKLGEKLGEWKVEGKIRDGLWIGGKKLYAANLGKKKNAEGVLTDNWKTASKGVKLSAERIVNVANGKEETWKNIAPIYSPFSPPKFISRKIRRADKRVA